MKRRPIAKLLLAAGIVFGGWEAGQELLPSPLSHVFNIEASAAEYNKAPLDLPQNTDEVWRIRIGTWEVAGSGYHTFLEFGPYCEKSRECPSRGDVYQIHGIAVDPQENAMADFSLSTFVNNPESSAFSNMTVLKVIGVHGDFSQNGFNKTPETYVDVYYGSKSDVLQMYLDSMKLAAVLNNENNAYDPLGQNSNSVQRTLTEGMGLKEPDLFVPDLGTSTPFGNLKIWAPGLDISLLPEDWSVQHGHAHLSSRALESAAKRASSGMNGAIVSSRSRDNAPPGPG